MLRITLLVLAALACHAAPASDDEAADHLYKSVIIADYETALSQSKDLMNEKRGKVISKTVDKLLAQNENKVMYYAYYLWNHDAQDIVKDYFPLEFRIIFGELSAELSNKKFGMKLKVGLHADSLGEKTVYANSNDVGARAVWKFIPLGGSKKVYFKIYNPNENQYLKTGKFHDGDGDYAIYTSTNSDTHRHEWYLLPMVYNKEILFYIVNRKYDKPLKLSQTTDSDGDRQAYVHGLDTSGAPERFGWKIVRS